MTLWGPFHSYFPMILWTSQTGRSLCLCPQGRKESSSRDSCALVTKVTRGQHEVASHHASGRWDDDQISTYTWRSLYDEAWATSCVTGLGVLMLLPPSAYSLSLLSAGSVLSQVFLMQSLISSSFLLQELLVTERHCNGEVVSTPCLKTCSPAKPARKMGDFTWSTKRGRTPREMPNKGRRFTRCSHF